MLPDDPKSQSSSGLGAGVDETNIPKPYIGLLQMNPSKFNLPNLRGGSKVECLKSRKQRHVPINQHNRFETIRK